ncbi:MAG: nuclear transport factor 2 family protein [Steroidobacteraceae bacterium]
MVAEAEKRKDAEEVSLHLSEGYVGIDPSGLAIDTGTLIGRYRSGDFNLNTLRLSDIVVRVHRDSAWEYGTMDLAGNLGAKQFCGRYRYSHYWIKADCSWRIAALHMTPVLAG